jgi:hypothetical protein
MYYYLGTAIFAALAILVVYAFYKQRARNRHYEETGEYEG